MDYFKGFGIDVGQGKYYEEAIYGVVLLYKHLNKEMSAHLSQFKLTPAKFNVLMIAKHQGGKEGISQVEISKKLVVTASNTARLIEKLEDEKLIHRIAQEGDRRVNIIKITDKGAKVLDEAWPGYVERLKQLTAGITQEDQKAVAALVTKWLYKLVGE